MKFRHWMTMMMVVGALAASARAEEVSEADRALQSEADEIMKQVAKVGEMEFKKGVPCKNMSREQLKEFFGGMIEVDFTEEALRKDTIALTMLGLIPEGTDLKAAFTALYSGAVAGFYDPEIAEFRFIDVPDGDKDVMQRLNEMLMKRMTGKSDKQSTMAHELYHAMQDQHFDLLMVQKRIADNSDESNATKCAIEGGASVIQWLYMFDGDANKAGGMLRQMASGGGGPAGPGMEGVPPYLRDSIIVPYTIGANFMWQVYAQQQVAGFNKAHTAPPASMEQVLHPEKFFGGETPTTLDLNGLHGVFKKNDQAWEKINEDTLGEFDYRLLLTYNGNNARTASRAAEGWQGDRFWIYELAESADAPRHVLVMTTTWDTEKDAAEFVTAYKKVLGKKYANAAGADLGETGFAQGGEQWTARILRSGTEVLVVEGLRENDQGLRDSLSAEFGRLVKKPHQPQQIWGSWSDDERDQLRLYENRYLGAELPVFKGWTVDEASSARPNGPLSISAATGAFQVLKVRQEGHVDMEAFRQALPKQIGSRVKDFKLRELRDTKIGERHAATIEFTGAVGGKSTYFHMTFARTSTYIFIFTGQAPATGADAAKRDFDRILEEADME